MAYRSPYESCRIEKKTKKNDNLLAPLKYNFIEFERPTYPEYLNTTIDSDYIKTINEIKKTRNELIEEYKSMIHSSLSQSPPKYEAVTFGQNCSFLRTNPTNPTIQRPRFEHTLELLIKNNNKKILNLK